MANHSGNEIQWSHVTVEHVLQTKMGKMGTNRFSKQNVTPKKNKCDPSLVQTDKGFSQVIVGIMLLSCGGCLGQ